MSWTALDIPSVSFVTASVTGLVGVGPEQVEGDAGDQPVDLVGGTRDRQGPRPGVGSTRTQGGAGPGTQGGGRSAILPWADLHCTFGAKTRSGGTGPDPMTCNAVRCEETVAIPKPTEHKTIQARILAYAREVGWAYVPRGEAEKRRGFDHARAARRAGGGGVAVLRRPARRAG